MIFVKPFPRLFNHQNTPVCIMFLLIFSRVDKEAINYEKRKIAHSIIITKTQQWKPITTVIWRVWFGFCALNFLSIFSDFLPREKLTQKSCAILQNFNSWIIKFTVKQEKQFGKIFVHHWCIPKNLGFFGVSFSRERKSERIERKLNAQNPILRHGFCHQM